jgi:conjugative transfer signal peptidase TraF
MTGSSTACRDSFAMKTVSARLTRLFATAAVVTAIACTVASHLRWNLTDSLPRGLYARWSATSAPSRGDIVAFDVPENVRQLVLGRGYLPSHTQLFKRVAAGPGDHVCLHDGRYEVNGTVLGPILATDSAGHPLPSARFCGRVPPDTYFVATSKPRSFDSRYFGALPRSALRDRLTPLWTF